MRRTEQPEDFDDVRTGGDKPSDGAVSLAKRPHIDEAVARNAEMLEHATTRMTQNARPMGVVDVEYAP